MSYEDENFRGQSFTYSVGFAVSPSTFRQLFSHAEGKGLDVEPWTTGTFATIEDDLELLVRSDAMRVYQQQKRRGPGAQPGEAKGNKGHGQLQFPNVQPDRQQRPALVHLVRFLSSVCYNSLDCGPSLQVLVASLCQALLESHRPLMNQWPKARCNVGHVHICIHW